MLKVTLGMFQEYQLGMMTFPFLPLGEDPGQWREAEVLLLKVPYYQAQMQKKKSIQLNQNHFVRIII